jgi:hypothetical protein
MIRFLLEERRATRHSPHICRRTPLSGSRGFDQTPRNLPDMYSFCRSFGRKAGQRTARRSCVFSPVDLFPENNPKLSEISRHSIIFLEFREKDEQERTSHMYHANRLFVPRTKGEETPMNSFDIIFRTSTINPHLRNTGEKKERKQAAWRGNLYSRSSQARFVCPGLDAIPSHHITRTASSQTPTCPTYPIQ